MVDLTNEISLSITETLARWVDPSQRIYWPFLLTSAAIALIFLLIKRESLREFFSARVWMHPSARMDYRLLFANTFVKTALWGSFALSALAVVVGTDGFDRTEGAKKKS